MENNFVESILNLEAFRMQALVNQQIELHKHTNKSLKNKMFDFALCWIIS